jgi:hypothetical protein
MERIRLLLITIDWIIGDCAYYDDETREVVIDSTEEAVYNRVANEEPDLKFLGEAKIRKYIHIAFTDFPVFAELQRTYKAYA